ncbi:cobalamin-binding protein [Lysinibacillus sp. KCTC 33748]|uniref:ABC transporter substrate-binding protein n=1 Tax=unclassified Lysinibacillus TaxID=2636778 RepID=UPI0009A9045E|nr:MULTISPECIES: cobalamin-binding protein [unclassified Lysinibacillus]OXS72274.1 cobalamin-binding protein [Lysinibacillus sp. KCTC 33748]SKB95974.1 iron complex transport system substrate-binding protein [Lysinibacillus sp. AC-3]
MKKMFKLQWLSVLMLALVLVGCGTKEDTNKDTVSKEDQQVEKTTSYKVKDDRGVEVEFNAVPKTIVSLKPSNTEILFALGVGDKIVGATEYDSYPEEAQKIERVSDSTIFNSERILALKPDVVIAYTTGDDEENLNALKGLEDAGIKVFAIQSAKSFDDVYGDIEQVSAAMGIKDKGEKLNEDIKSKIADVQAKVKDVKEPKNIYLEISPKPDIYTAGSDTFQQEILNAANVNNVFVELKSWAMVSEEDVIAKNPEVILTTVGNDSTGEILSRDGWNSITAIKNKAVYSIDNDISNRPGPRIGEAVELIAKAVYPELFK